MDPDPIRIALRVAFAYVLLLVLIRFSGKHTVRQGNPFDLVLALVLGDMVDDVIWGEASVAVFAMGATVLSLLHWACDVATYKAGNRLQRSGAALRRN